MTEDKQNILSDVEELFDKGEFDRTLELIEKKDAKQIQQLGNTQISTYYHLFAKCLFMKERYNEAEKKIETAIKYSRKTGNNDLIAKQKYLWGQIMHKNGLILKAIREYTESYDMFKLAEDYKSILAVQNALAIVHYDRGEIRQALDLFHKQIKICDEHGFLEIGIRRRLNLSQTWAKGGRFQEALEQLSSLEKNNSDEEVSAHIKRFRGMIYTMQMRSDDARKLLNSATEYYISKGLQRYEDVCLEYLGLNEDLSLNHGKAKEYYLKVLGRDEIAASAETQTLRFLTENCIAAGDFTEASETAAKARKAIGKSQERIELGALYRADAQIHAHNKCQKKAEQCFTESIDILRETGARYELAVTFLAYGLIDVFSHSKRIEFLRRAKGLFVETDVTKRVKQIDEELKKLQGATLTPIGANVELKEVSIPGSDSTFREMVWHQVD